MYEYSINLYINKLINNKYCIVFAMHILFNSINLVSKNPTTCRPYIVLPSLPLTHF